MLTHVTVTVAPDETGGRQLLAPVGLPTPHQVPVRFAVEGAGFELTGEVTTGQMAALVSPAPGTSVRFVYTFADGGPGYPDGLFRPQSNRYTKAAGALVRDAHRLADGARDGHAAIEAIVNDVAGKFVYGHPEVRFNDGLEEIPYLSCGVTEGSCVDINTYLIACLRAAGFEAGYMTGYFFPEEKDGCCDDMHCWVVTRHNGVVLEWDIAHHLKMGTRQICCGLNPKPGSRVVMAHSMGLDFPQLGIAGTKLIAEPLWVNGDGTLARATLDIRMQKAQPDASEAAA